MQQPFVFGFASKQREALRFPRQDDHGSATRSTTTGVCSASARRHRCRGGSWPGAVLALALVAEPGAAGGTASNVLLVIADDLGVDRVGAYEESADPGRTPHIDALAAEGVLFRNAWAHPICSPTRAAMLTGRHPFRTGVGAVFKDKMVPGNPMGGTNEPFSFSPGAVSLPLLVGRASGGSYATAALGKWHLAAAGEAMGHPLQCGFDLSSGSLFNLDDYYEFPKAVNDAGVLVSKYATVDTTDDAIASVHSLPEPWFVWLAYNAPHVPVHEPPAELHSYELSGHPIGDQVDYTKAMIEALDTEIGRLFMAMGPDLLARTNVVFVGDNGTAPGAVEPPLTPETAKSSVYEGGVNVPLIVAGPAVDYPGRECAALVHAADLWATVLELTGSQPPADEEVDSVSLVPYLADPGQESIREHVYSERFYPNGFGPYELYRRAIRDERYKLVHLVPEQEEHLFDLEQDPYEQSDLLEGTLTLAQAGAYERLWAHMDAMGQP